MTDPGDRSGSRPFLTARWVNLCLFSFETPRELLAPLLAPGLELDSLDGKAFVSLVAFQFLDTRVKGCRIPGHVNFPELNLRFYVRDGDRRGVMFVREYVPRRAIAVTARLLYNEPYLAAAMTARVTREGGRLEAMYGIRRGGREHRMGAVARDEAWMPEADSAEHFFKEHEWGYGVSRRGERLTYRVEHPQWRVYPIESVTIDVDWAALYGPQWRVMQDVEPYSTVLAEGSETRVMPLSMAAKATPAPPVNG
ncbi:DUF2071 domain-containing protein [Pyruvatibacter sp.]|uniref:YqjF family protein n=1 Tax=Pyruvatibacter sp. TaxID=1981328 RepID=UPI0032EE6677